MQNGTSEIIIRSHAPELQEAKLMNMQAARVLLVHLSPTVSSRLSVEHEHT